MASTSIGAGEKRKPAIIMEARNLIIPRPVSAPVRSKLLPSGFNWGIILARAARKLVEDRSQN
jgi:hypothetical protein